MNNNIHYMNNNIHNMNNISNNLSLCPHINCTSVPKINLLKDSQQIQIICNAHDGPYKRIADISKYLEQNKNIEKKLICSICHSFLGENNSFFYCNTCQKFYCIKCNYNKLFHDHMKINGKLIDFWNKCRIHNAIYSKYCKTCSISLCNNCNEIPHKNHIIINIIEKNKNEKDKLKNNLEIQEKAFKIVEKSVKESLEKIRIQLEFKKLILNNYLNYGSNGNSIENLNEFFHPLNEYYKQKIENLDNENASFNDKFQSLQYFHKMCNSNMNEELYNKDINNNIEQQFEINNKENSNNIGKKALKQEIFKKSFKNENSITPNKNSIKKSDHNILESYENKKLKIYSITEDIRVICMIRLSSGNLAIGFSNGIIKIYDVNTICSNKFEKKEQEIPELLKIINFKGKRISYLYELKDKTLLCATISKIHHIQLTNGDQDFKYIGSKNISKKEVPKRIIELGHELIVSLGEKKYQHENLTKTKCLLKIFNKIQDSKRESEENSFCLLSDNSDFDSVGSSLSSNSNNEWEEVYSSPDEDSFENIKEKNFQDDDKIKLYRNNQNKDHIYICSIFPIESNNKKDGIIYEFIATSNKEFYHGENSIQIYGIIKTVSRHGFTFFIHKTLNGLSCSRMVDSISKLNDKFIGIGLQKYNENNIDGIAILDIDNLEIVNIIKGLSIGLLNTSINNSKFIFFSTNQTKDVRKSNEIRLYKIKDIKKDRLSKMENKIIFNINSGFWCLVELLPSNNIEKKIYYVCSYNSKLFYVIQVDNNLE